MKTPRPTPVDERRCVHQGPAGQCRAYALRDGSYCFLHDPNKAEQRALAQRKGGVCSHKRGWRVKGLPDAQPPQSAQGVADVMANVIAGVLRGEVDPRIANSTAYCVGVLIKAIEVGELEKRIDTLEKALERKEKKQK